MVGYCHDKNNSRETTLVMSVTVLKPETKLVDSIWNWCHSRFKPIKGLLTLTIQSRVVSAGKLKS